MALRSPDTAVARGGETEAGAAGPNNTRTKRFHKPSASGSTHLAQDAAREQFSFRSQSAHFRKL